jgi:alkylglycerol monooxygenase
MHNLIAFAIPVFFVLIGVEVLVARLQGRRVYRFDDAIVDLSCGVAQQVTTPFYAVLIAIPYAWVYEHLRMVTFSDGSVLVWVIGFFGVDLGYYWWHRWTHEVNLGWTTHVVHHQSEEYNLAVALRQSLTSSLSSWPFYLPLAVIGVPPAVLLTHAALNTLYQFWIHTETIGKLGPLEWVMNTPSHHRVHHAINPGYLDKNYAGVLIVWDRLFGSFVEETEVPVYGTVKPLNSFNPLWANIQWASLVTTDSLRAPTLADGLFAWFARPGWRPAGLEPYPSPAPITRDEQHKYAPRGFPGIAPYVAAHFVPVAVVTTAMLWFEESASRWTLVVPCVLVLWTMAIWGGLFERRSWAVPLEYARLLAVGLTVQTWGVDVKWVALTWGLVTLSIGWLTALTVADRTPPRRAPRPPSG